MNRRGSFGAPGRGAVLVVPGAVLVAAVGVLAAALFAALPAAATPPSGQRFTACLVVGDGAGSELNPSAEAGLRDARRLGVAGVTERAATPAGQIGALEACLDAHADLTIAVGSSLANAVDVVASTHRTRRFALLDASQSTLPHRPGNVTGVMFRNQESAFLAGYAAALWAKARTKGDDVAVGSVGSIDIPPVDRYIAGFEAGARQAVPGITLLRRYSEDEVDPRACRLAAAAELRRGAKVVLAVAGACGRGVLAAGSGRDVMAIVTDSPSLPAIDPSVMTSVIDHADVAVLRVVAAARRQALGGGRDLWLGVGTGGVALGPWSPRVPAAIRRAVAARLRLLRAGRAGAIPTTLG